MRSILLIIGLPQSTNKLRTPSACTWNIPYLHLSFIFSSVQFFLIFAVGHEQRSRRATSGNSPLSTRVQRRHALSDLSIVAHIDHARLRICGYISVRTHADRVLRTPASPRYIFRHRKFRDAVRARFSQIRYSSTNTPVELYWNSQTIFLRGIQFSLPSQGSPVSASKPRLMNLHVHFTLHRRTSSLDSM
jgi:hypothetical protein